MKRVALSMIVLFMVLVTAPVALACTTFCLQIDDRVVFGRNYDWSFDDGFVSINKRNMNKKLYSRDGKLRFSWTSKYGSVSFNQYGKESPMDGMNEQGLAVAQMWLSGSKYQAEDKRPVLGPLLWIQYQLDNSGSVAEVLESDQEVRIGGNNVSPLHFLVCDKTGNAATIEFLNGKRVVHQGKALTISALANNAYAESVQYFQNDWKGEVPVTEGITANSLDRFSKAAQMISDLKQQSTPDPIAYGRDILNAVASVKHTQWSILYDVTNLEVGFKTKSQPAIRQVKLTDHILDCKQGARISDLNTGSEKTVTFDPYSTDLNHKYVRLSFKKTKFLKNVPDQALKSIASFPERFECAE